MPQAFVFLDPSALFGIPAEFPGISVIWDCDLGLVLKIWNLGLGFGNGFENRGSGIAINRDWS